MISRMTGLYGPFASTIGLFAYVSLVVQVFVIGTEVNVVRSRRLWPRAWTPELGPADLRAIELSMGREALSPPGATGSTGTPPQPPNEACEDSGGGAPGMNSAPGYLTTAGRARRASCVSWSRNFGCATAISRSARWRTEASCNQAMPCSVTTTCAS